MGHRTLDKNDRQMVIMMMMRVMCMPDEQFHTAGRFTNRSQLFFGSPEMEGRYFWLVIRRCTKTTDGHMMWVLCMLLDISLGCRPIFMFINKPKHPQCTTKKKHIVIIKSLDAQEAVAVRPSKWTYIVIASITVSIGIWCSYLCSFVLVTEWRHTSPHPRRLDDSILENDIKIVHLCSPTSPENYL